MRKFLILFFAIMASLSLVAEVEPSQGTVTGWVRPTARPYPATLKNAAGVTRALFGVYRQDWARAGLIRADGKETLVRMKCSHLKLRGDEWIHLAFVWEKSGRARLFVNGHPSDTASNALDRKLIAKGLPLGDADHFELDAANARDFRLEKRAWTAAEVVAAYRAACPVDLVMDDSLVDAGEPDAAEWLIAPGGTYTRPQPAEGLKPVTATLELSTSVRAVAQDGSKLVGPVLAETPFRRLEVTKPILLSTPERRYAEGLYRLAVRLRRPGETNDFLRSLFFRAIPRTDLAKRPATKCPWRKTETLCTKVFQSTNDVRCSSGATVVRTNALGTYLEAGPEVENRFDAILSIPKSAIGHACLLEIEWPDDKPRAMGLYMYEIQTASCRDHLGGGLVAGEEISNSHSMQTRSYLYYPINTNILFETRTFIAGRPAAVAKVTLSRLEEPLPVLAVRHPKTARARTFGHTDEDQTFDNNITACQHGLLNSEITPALTNLIAYCGYTGQNAFSFSPLRYGFLGFGPRDQETSLELFPREQGAWKGLVRELHRNGIAFVAQQRAPNAITFCRSHLIDNTFAERGLTLPGATGGTRGDVWPDLSKSAARDILFADLLPTLRHLGEAKADAINVYLNDEISASTAFARANVGEQDPAKRCAIVTEATKDLLGRMAAVAPGTPVNLELRADAEAAKRAGIDPDALARALPSARLMVQRNTTMYYFRLFWSAALDEATDLDELYHPDAPELVRLAKLSPGGSLPVVYNQPVYFETFVHPLGNDKRFQNYFQNADLKPHGRWFLKDPAYCLAKCDMSDYAVGMQPLGSFGSETETREWTQAFCSLPALPFKTMPGEGDPVVGRYRATEEGTYVYAVNWSHLPVTVSLVPSRVDAEDLSTGARADLASVALRPFELRSFLVPADVTPAFRVTVRALDTAIFAPRLKEVEKVLAVFEREGVPTAKAREHVAKAKAALAKGHAAATHYWLHTGPVNAAVQRYGQLDDLRAEAAMHRAGRWAVNCGTPVYTRIGDRLFSPDRPWDGETYGRTGSAARTVARNLDLVQSDAAERILFASEAMDIDGYKFKLPKGRYHVKLHAKWSFPRSFEMKDCRILCRYSVNGRDLTGMIDFYKLQGGDIRKPLCFETDVDVEDVLSIEIESGMPGDGTVRILNGIEIERVSDADRGLPVFGDSFDAVGTFAENWVSKNCRSESGVVKMPNGGSLRMRGATPVEFVFEADVAVTRTKGVDPKKQVWGGLDLGGFLFAVQPEGKTFCVWRLPEDARSSGKYVKIPDFTAGAAVRLRLVRKTVPGGVKYAYSVNGEPAGEFIAASPETDASGNAVRPITFFGYNCDLVIDNVLLSTVRHGDDSPNMIFNSGFEHGEDGVPTYYGLFGQFNYAERPAREYETRYLKRYAMDSNERHSGKYSLRVAVNSASRSIEIAPWQTGTVKGQPGVFSAWLKASTNGLPVTLSFAPSGGDGRKTVPVTTEWTRYEVTRDVLPGKGTYSPVRLTVSNPGRYDATLWVDDLQAEIVPRPKDGFVPTNSYATAYKASELDRERFAAKKETFSQQTTVVRKLPKGIRPSADFATWTAHADDSTRLWMNAVEPRVPTAVYAACDENNLYLGFRNFRENPASLNRPHSPRDAMIYQYDGLELFFKPDSDGGSYHYMATANGDRFDCYANDIQWNGAWRTQARENKAEDAVDILVTLPFADFAPNGFSGRWLVNLCRNELSQKDRPVFAQSGKSKKADYRNEEFWSSLVLPPEVAAKWSGKVRRKAVAVEDRILGRLNYYMNEKDAAWRVTREDGSVVVATKPLAEIPMGTNLVTFAVDGRTYSDTVVRLPYRQAATQINRWARCVVKNGEKILFTAPAAGCIGWFGYKPGAKTYDTLMEIIRDAGFTSTLMLTCGRRSWMDEADVAMAAIRRHGLTYANWCDYGMHNWSRYPTDVHRDRRITETPEQMVAKFRPYEDFILTNLVIDEPELGFTSDWTRSWLEYMKDFYPYLPVQMNNTVMGVPSRFANLETDILMLDDYLTNREGRSVDSVVRQVDYMRAAPGGKPCWFFIVSHNATLHYKLPSYDEQIAQSWGCLCAGCSGLAWYFELPVTEGTWRAMKQVNREAQALKDVLLSEELCGEATVDQPKSVVRHLTKTHAGDWYVFTCNLDAKPLERVTFTLPADAPRNGQVEVLYENRTLPLRNGVFVDRYAGHARHLYRVNVIVADSFMSVFTGRADLRVGRDRARPSLTDLNPGHHNK